MHLLCIKKLRFRGGIEGRGEVKAGPRPEEGASFDDSELEGLGRFRGLVGLPYCSI